MSGTVGDNLFRASGVVASSSTAFDDDQIQSNIAMLGFKVATNGSLVRYNLVDQVIDEYNDTSGVDASASTNEVRSDAPAPFYYYGESGSAPTGGDSTDTSISGYTTHVFTSSRALTVNGTGDATMLVVAGGSSGGCNWGGGGGAGGLIYKATHELTTNTYDAVIGAGGAAQTTTDTVGNSGVNTTWTINGGAVEFTAVGGGGGAGGSDAANIGGSGGGGSYGTTGPGAGAAANQPSQSGDSGTYGFGYAGGPGSGPGTLNTGGGGGAGSVGEGPNTSRSGSGGTGKDYSAIFGTSVGDSGWFASGGGGGWTEEGGSGAGPASSGGGSAGAASQGANAGAATANTGGGSGGGASSQGDSGTGGSGVLLVRVADGAFINKADLTLQSVDGTAGSAPSYGELLTLIENAAGTATINTDIKGYISRDSGTTFTQGTLVDEGSWGTNKKILAFHDLDISGQPSGTSMCYKITTHNQSASKVTRIYATSIGWR
jgi:hypothetical protein